MLRRFRVIVPLILLALIMSTLALSAACEEGAQPDQVKEAVAGRWRTYDRAKAKYPPPQTVNFPIREALIEFTLREDAVNHPWWIYVTGLDGKPIGDFYIAKTPPLNECLFLSSTQDVEYDSDGGNVVLIAPSYDGVFYGGGGASGACQQYFFFDFTTNGMVISGQRFITSDVPLFLPGVEQNRVIPDAPVTDTLPTDIEPLDPVLPTPGPLVPTEGE